MKQLEGRLPMTTLTQEPAFPVNGATSWYPGMTLRDYFAAQAMLRYYWGGHPEINLQRSQECYEIADAMMEARKQGGKDGADI